jgi:hypothetical protein
MISAGLVEEREITAMSMRKIGLALAGCLVVSGLAVAQVTWEQAQERLRTGEPPALEATLGAPAEDPDAYGAESNPTGDPIGGGEGYRDILTTGDFIVGTRQELLDALGKATAGQVVYVKPDAEIDLTGDVQIVVIAGITLAGNRGHNGAAGPLLFTDEMPENANWGLFRLKENVRVTGVRLRGPDPDYDKYPDRETQQAIKALAARGLMAGTDSEIDNCEISNFYRDGINAHGEKNVHIHHNFIHDVAAYPIITGGGPGCSALIEANLIHWGWHGIAGNGQVGSGYEARYNIFRPHVISSPFGDAVQHCLDQHADRQILIERKEFIAADWMKWHHNTIYLEGATTDPLDTEGMKIRGTPRILAEVHHNWFPTTEDPAPAFGPYAVERVESACGNVWYYRNAFGPQKRLLDEIAPRTAPQILLKQPAPPSREIEKISGRCPVVIEVNTFDGLKLAGVRVALDDEELFLAPRAPEPEESVIDATELEPGRHTLTVTAVDVDGRLGRQFVHLDTEE